MDQAITRTAGAQPSAASPAVAAPRLVGEFQGYIDGLVPSVRWLDRKNMPAVGSKLYALPPGAAEPRTWSLLLTSANHGTVGPVGSTFPHAGEKHERVQVVEIVEAGAPPAPDVDLAGLVRITIDGTVIQLAVPSAPAQAEPAAPPDISRMLRAYVNGNHKGPYGGAELMLTAADEIERYYGGMMAWKQTAQKKDRDWQAERMERVNERCAVRAAVAEAGVAIPAGWKLVPESATPEMQAAGGHSNSEWLNDNAPIGEARYAMPMESVWTAMLAAAPAISHSGEGEKGGIA